MGVANLDMYGKIFIKKEGQNMKHTFLKKRITALVLAAALAVPVSTATHFSIQWKFYFFKNNIQKKKFIESVP